MTNSESENRWQGFVAVPEIEEWSCRGCCFGTPHPEHTQRTKCLRPEGAPSCTAVLREDKRDIIWQKDPNDG